MDKRTNVEWCHHEFAPWHESGARQGETSTGTCVAAPEHCWQEPIAWNREAAAAGERRRVLCVPATDVFEDRPDLEVPRDDLFDLIAGTPHLDWLLLTKRPQNIERLMRPKPSAAVPVPCLGGGDYFHNVWLGVSVEDQVRADERIPLLLQVPATVRFLSIEPLLGPVDIDRHLYRTMNRHLSLNVAGAIRNGSFDGFTDAGKPLSRAAAKAELQRMHAAGVKLMPMGECEGFSPETGCPGHHLPGIDWVIVGGESGPGARPMHPDWARSIRDQCAGAGVPFFFKQWGEHAWSPDDMNYSAAIAWGHKQFGGVVEAQAHSSGHTSFRVGKAKAGRLLDGRLHDEFPAKESEVPRG